VANNARQRGDYFEYQTRDALRAVGWFVIRAAGSKGIADLVALRAGNTPLLVSCKLSGRIGPAERQSLLDAAYEAGAKPVVALRPGRGRVQLCRVLPEGKRIVAWDLLKVPPRYQVPDELLTPQPAGPPRPLGRKTDD
jgi:Holliday junction resolvase